MGKSGFEEKYGQYGKMPASEWILADESHLPDAQPADAVFRSLDDSVDLHDYTTLIPSSEYYYYEDDREAVFYLDETKREELLRCEIVERLDSGAEGNDIFIFQNDRYMAVFTSIMDYRGTTASEVFRTGRSLLFKKTE
jgi:hypothetical protein